MKSRESNNSCLEKEIVKLVCRKYDVLEEDVFSTKRNAELSLVRKIIMYLCSRFTEMSIKDISIFMGNKDYTTVMFGISGIKSLMTRDDRLEITVRMLEFELFCFLDGLTCVGINESS